MSNPAPGFIKHPNYEVLLEPSTSTLTVKAGETVIAESQRAVQVLETKHRPVWYMPFEDVEQSCVTPTDTDTFCPFKGHASYWSVTTPDGLTI